MLALAWLGHGSRLWPLQGGWQTLSGQTLRVAGDGQARPRRSPVSTRCRNKLCVRHLHFTSRAEIMASVPRRWASGEDSWLARTTAKTVLQLRKLYAKGGLTQAMLAERFCLLLPNVKSILGRSSWKHI
jgi:hypothetical protein